jgi:hypothetical protein
MKIRPVRAEIFLADRQTNRYVYDDVIVAFLNFANAPKNDFCYTVKN